ncbi:MAG: hypothetical protein ACYSTY_00685 [Planctomycetota bacterium]|jgi:hypothetical protein
MADAPRPPKMNPLVPLIALAALVAVNVVIVVYAARTGVFGGGSHAAEETHEELETEHGATTPHKESFEQMGIALRTIML